ncbi:hypothetical protein HYX17_01495 [Candidatus Woesearchaeota archaeon]|nr:hypothetical protein [Candidatus Woesearchaeota archaeon]
MKRKSIKLKYILIGGGIGFLVGFSLFWLESLIPEENFPKLIIYSSYPIIYLFNYIGRECSEGCLGFILESYTITYSLLGMIIGYLFYKIKTKYE